MSNGHDIMLLRLGLSFNVRLVRYTHTTCQMQLGGKYLYFRLSGVCSMITVWLFTCLIIIWLPPFCPFCTMFIVIVLYLPCYNQMKYLQVSPFKPLAFNVQLTFNNIWYVLALCFIWNFVQMYLYCMFLHVFNCNCVTHQVHE